jgi:uncharacterized protein YkwD
LPTDPLAYTLPIVHPILRCLFVGAFVVQGCGAATSADGTPHAGTKARTAKKDKPKGPPAPVPRPAGLLAHPEAERYMLALINRDREAEGLEPVEWDPIAAKAGLAHSDDMAASGYTAHIGTDGSNPELRYTEAGGEDMSQENAGCFADAKARDLDPDPRFDPALIEKVQAAFMAEKPPQDGHRKNILRPWHSHVGVGLSQAKGVPVVCMAQEFIDRYGTYAPLPKQGKVGDRIKVAGTIRGPAKIMGVGLARVDLPSPRKPADLLKTSSYPIPAPFVTWFPKGFVTPIPIDVQGDDFSITIPISDKPSSPSAGRPGLYEVSVWAEIPDTRDAVMVSLRTIRVK